MEVSTLKRGRRGEATHFRKLALYLVKRLCDLTLQETAWHFGVESYRVLGGAYAQVVAKQINDPRFKKLVEALINTKLLSYFTGFVAGGGWEGST